MNPSNTTLEKKYLHEITNLESIPNKSIYNTFINWLSGEFELNLQEQNTGLQVYFPTGTFQIKEIETNSSFINFQIIIQSKSKQRLSKINNQIHAVLEHVLRVNN